MLAALDDGEEVVAGELAHDAGESAPPYGNRISVSLRPPG